MKHLLQAVSLSFFLFLIAGCDNGTTTDTTGAPSKVEYDYSGSQSGSFKVNGAYPSQKNGSGASSTLSSDRKSVTISAITWTKSGSEANFISITLGSSVAIQDNQTFTLTDPNSNAVVISGYGLNYPAYSPSEAYLAISGSIKLTTVKDNQIKATFDFVTKNNAGNTITISNGMVDAKY